MTLRTNAAFLPVFCHRDAGGRFRISVETSIATPAHGSVSEKIHYLTQEYAKRLERAVRRHPDQWLLFFELFDRRDGLPLDPARLEYERTNPPGSAKAPLPQTSHSAP